MFSLLILEAWEMMVVIGFALRMTVINLTLFGFWDDKADVGGDKILFLR